MNILFVSQEKYSEENIRDFFNEINFRIEYITFKEYSRNLETLDLIAYDFIFIELLGSKKRVVNYIGKCQEQNISSFISVIYIFENININSLIKDIRLDKFDYLIKPFESKDILKKINLHNKNRPNTMLDNYKMIVKGKLLKPLEHQWKQPLNLIATNLLSLEIKSELSKLSHSDIETANEKVDFAINRISNSLSNLNECFDTSHTKSYFKINNAYERILEFILPQTIKHNIELKEIDKKNDIEVFSYQNEFSLNILILLHTFIQWLIDSKTSEKEILIDFSYEQEGEKIHMNIAFNEILPLYSISNKYNLEFIVIKELLKKIGLVYKSSINDENTLIKITL